MGSFTAADVKKLREETDAPMMECNAALKEAEGDLEKAKAILREKGKAAAGKRAGRSTSAGVVAVAPSADGKTVGAVVLESETDFVAKNEDFIKIAQQIAEMYRDNDPSSDPMAVSANGTTVRDLVEGAVGKIRENIKVTKALRVTSDQPIATYVHHDKTKGAIVQLTGEAGAGSEAVRKIGVQIVSAPPEVINKEELPQDRIDAEIEIETQRAMNDGKPENIARNIAQGRVNKEYIKKAVLMEQPFYADQNRTVSQYLSEEAQGAKVAGFTYLAVGQSE
ncbi:MAG TPA: translation elongation factor Ts [Fimbriimonadaceae bacterium]|nr:translation elongation factor Ts [Fimbriimonadaceae bacterium]